MNSIYIRPLIIAQILLSAFLLPAQSNQKMCVSNILYTEFPTDVIANKDNSYYLLGTTIGKNDLLHPDESRYLGPRSEEDVILMRISAKGDTLWTKHYYENTDDEAINFIKTKDNCLVIQCALSPSEQKDSMRIFKTDSNGTILWKKIIPGRPGAIKQTSDGGYIFFTNTKGVYFSYPRINTNIVLIKLNNTGDIQWIKKMMPCAYYDTRTLRDRQFDTTTHNGYIFFAHRYMMSDTEVKIADPEYLNNNVSVNLPSYYNEVIKLNNRFEYESETILKTNKNFLSMVFFPNEEEVALLEVPNDNTNDMQSLLHRKFIKQLAKFDSTGKMLWCATLDTVDSPYDNSLDKSSDGGFLVSISDLKVLKILKVDANGNVVYRQEFDERPNYILKSANIIEEKDKSLTIFCKARNLKTHYKADGIYYIHDSAVK